MQPKSYAKVSSLALLVLIAFLLSPPAHAYLDGATASMIFQMVIAGGLGAVVVARSYWTQIKVFFGSRFKK